MRRVEFIGANGVGKTTVVRQLLLDTDGAALLLDQHQARHAVANASLGDLKASKRLFRQLEFLQASRRKRRAKQLRDQEVERLLASDDGQVARFVELTLTIIGESDLSVHDKKNQTAWFFDALYDAVYMDNAELSVVSLCDESLSLKTLMVAMLADSREKVLELFGLMPLPDMLVHVSGAEEKIHDRLVRRERNTDHSHIHYLRNRSKDEVIEQLVVLNDIAAQGCRIMQTRGGNIAYLDVDGNNVEGQVEVLRANVNLLASGLPPTQGVSG
ncbi:hypothetical protein [Halomonas sp. BC04]|uniref:hypothetical protein n=1 Tax=Halomonas sp. BC04 TaxID=1403540 RepID=UPI0003ED8776|nr:hypothetical protein [Halomonas sp. BC04]EWG99638.1 hypothetical protein Q427_23750 [Halomonas sp. BC04]